MKLFIVVALLLSGCYTLPNTNWLTVQHSSQVDESTGTDIAISPWRQLSPNKVNLSAWHTRHIDYRVNYYIPYGYYGYVYPTRIYDPVYYNYVPTVTVRRSISKVVSKETIQRVWDRRTTPTRRNKPKGTIR
jgi:hypothetical protein|tara:strand:+ start:4749 stop:5144 length:396 start_codon:yes stop_codon:yes gene_type:complete